MIDCFVGKPVEQCDVLMVVSPVVIICCALKLLRLYYVPLLTAYFVTCLRSNTSAKSRRFFINQRSQSVCLFVVSVFINRYAFLIEKF